MKGDIPNLQLGEVRYYPQDNPNILRDTTKEILPKTLNRIFKTLFPDYIVDVDEESNLVNNIHHKSDTISYHQ